MKYNSTLFNKLFNTTNNNQINTNSSIINNNNNIKVSPSTTSNTNMATALTNIPLSNPLATSTRFTDEYDLKEELGK
jgi:hypothetical protein